MLRLKNFWILTSIFTVFSVAVIIIAVNLWLHNEHEIQEHAMRAYTESAKYLSKSLKESDSAELQEELEQNHLKMECLASNCQPGVDFKLLNTFKNSNDTISIFHSSGNKIGILIKTNTRMAFLTTNEHESERHQNVVTILAGLTLLMSILYLLAISNLKKTQKIKELLEAKDEFLCAVSHEIKTPLAKAKLALEFMPESQKKELAKGAIRQIDSLSSSLLNANKHANNKKSIIFVSEILQLTMSQLAQTDGIYADIISDFQIECNENELSMALKNIVENALKHSDNNKCKITISKNVIEIENLAQKTLDTLEELVKPFKKDEDSTGFGIGLYLVKNITDRNSIKLGLEQVGGVVRFTMRFC